MSVSVGTDKIHTFPPGDALTIKGPGSAPRFTVPTPTHGPINVANSIDGTDGPVLLAISAALRGPTTVVVPPNTVITNATLVVPVGVPTGPTRRNSYFVKAPTGDIGLTPSGGTAAVTLPGTGCFTPSAPRGTAHPTEVPLDTT